uniref:(northern house mosquito) hypothetical protein n=1 Tax=Culex pipiens TaxID=7175 RepID=A0A8D8AAX9_CULPI
MFLFVVVLNGEKALSKGGSLVTWQVATSFPCPAGVCFLHQVAPTSKSRSTARETPLIITTREKKGCFSWFVDEWEKLSSAFPRNELVLPSRSWSSTPLRRFETDFQLARR